MVKSVRYYDPGELARRTKLNENKNEADKINIPFKDSYKERCVYAHSGRTKQSAGQA